MVLVYRKDDSKAPAKTVKVFFPPPAIEQFQPSCFLQAAMTLVAPSCTLLVVATVAHMLPAQACIGVLGLHPNALTPHRPVAVTSLTISASADEYPTLKGKERCPSYCPGDQLAIFSTLPGAICGEALAQGKPRAPHDVASELWRPIIQHLPPHFGEIAVSANQHPRSDAAAVLQCHVSSLSPVPLTALS